MHIKGIPLPLVEEAAKIAKSKKRSEDTFEGQGVTVEKPKDDICDISQMPEMIEIPGMRSPESADNIKKLAEKKRGYRQDSCKNEEPRNEEKQL